MMRRRNCELLSSPSAMPLDPGLMQQQLHSHAGSSAASRTPVMGAMTLTESPSEAGPLLKRLPTAVRIPMGRGGAQPAASGPSTSCTLSGEVPQCPKGVSPREPALHQYTHHKQQVRRDVVHSCPLNNHCAVEGMSGSRLLPTLSAMGLGEPPLMPGLPGTKSGGTAGMGFATPLSVVLDAPLPMPFPSTTPANANVSVSECAVPMTRSPAPTPMKPTEHSSTNLILYNTGPDMTEACLHYLFDPFGEVITCAVMRDIHTGIGLGTAFVRYSTHTDARRALEAFSDRTNPVCVHDSKPLVVQWARKQHDDAPAGEARKKIMKLFVRNVPVSCTAEDLEFFFERYGGVRQVTLHKDTSPVKDEAMVRLIAFVIYTEEGAAERAAREVHNTKPFTSCNGIPIMVKLAESSQRRRFMRNTESNGLAVFTAGSAGCAGCAGARTSPVIPGLGILPVDVAPAVQQQQHLHHRPALFPQGMYEAHGSEPSPTFYSMPVFDGSAACVPPDTRDASTSLYQTTPHPPQISPSSAGIPVPATPTGWSIMGGSPGLYRQQASTYFGDMEDRVSPYSLPAAASSIPAHSYHRCGSSFFEPNAAATYAGVSVFSTTNCHSLPDRAAAAGSASACPSGSFLYSSTNPLDAAYNSSATAVAPVNDPAQIVAGGAWYGDTSESGLHSSGSTVPTQSLRSGVEVTCSPPGASAAFSGSTASPAAPFGPGCPSSPLYLDRCGSPQQSTGLHRTSPTHVAAPCVKAVHHPLSRSAVPAGVEANMTVQSSMRLSAGSSVGVLDMNAAGLSSTCDMDTMQMGAAAPARESPTLRTDACESWRRAVRTHVDNTKRHGDRCKVSGSLPSMSSMDATSSGLPPATLSPASSRKVSIFSFSYSEAFASGATPSVSPISSSALSCDRAGLKASGTGASPGRVRYYNNPYSLESAKLFF
ncbi:hypothetical protein JKF63_00535 [Porcisia hertigi]|uniref:RRM domain-containing protein n=1 Tax=Porcisia hertigi TaxID=2761500 RepID=A0A836L154_9TRYP|nr:hypothetical protein JKF63_00535 [Porcisia hertigi]